MDAEFLRGMKSSPCRNVGFAVSNSELTTSTTYALTRACLSFHGNVSSFGRLSEILDS